MLVGKVNEIRRHFIEKGFNVTLRFCLKRKGSVGEELRIQ